jgi:ferritin-like metal-binding protein YciE
MAVQDLENAFVEELKDVLSAEKQITKALKKMAKAASHDKLRKAFEAHLEQTHGHIERLEQVFEYLELKPRSKHCAAMEGLLEEGGEIVEEDAEPEAKDALLIAAAQKVEHYEIATYGTLCAWADQLGFTEARKLLDKNLVEEKQTDEKLTKLSQTVNRSAVPA